MVGYRCGTGTGDADLIRMPHTKEEHDFCRKLLADRNGGFVSDRAHFLCDVVDGKVHWIVAYDGFNGKTCLGAFASDHPRWFPRRLRYKVFDYAFNYLKRELFLVTINSRNEPSMRMVEWLGFKRLYNFEGMCQDGADMILLGMMKAECKWLPGEQNVVSEARYA